MGNKAHTCPKRAPLPKNEKDREYLAEQGIRFEKDDPADYPLIHLPPHLKFECFASSHEIEWMIVDTRSDTSSAAVTGKDDRYSTAWYWDIYADNPISTEELQLLREEEIQRKIEEKERESRKRLKYENVQRQIKEEIPEALYNKLLDNYRVTLNIAAEHPIREIHTIHVNLARQKIIDFCQKYPSFEVPKFNYSDF